MSAEAGDDDSRTLAAGRFLALRAAGHWEYATRVRGTGVVAIVALTDAPAIVLVEQVRVPVGGPVIELPAGLVGDDVGHTDEALLDAAKRELWEETGLTATTWRVVGDGPSSAGLSDEIVTLLVATGLTRSGPGGGDASEDITVHEVPLADATAWLAAARRRGALIDAKVLAGLYVAGMGWDGTAFVP
ncbi:MAG: NUDIX hydrolase [Alphaproteobacteria bacterium]|nr:NUDIX hydrolase [Alphaproteobacteria bacterium]